jgi:FtsH-binding integral membrane protein
MFNRENRKKKTEKRRIRLEVYFFILCSMFFSLSANAQCAMCRAALTSEGNAVKAQAVNDGIVYLMVIPYLLVGGIGYYIYRMRKKKKK